MVSAASIALLAHASSYLPFIADDALISLRYAERFVDGRGLTWNDGEWVEGYSNLLWVLLCAELAGSGVDPIVATRVLGLAGCVAAILALARAYPPRSLAGALPALSGALGLALSGPIAVWCVGGLEQPLLAGLLAWSLVSCFPLLEAPEAGGGARWLLPGSLLALLCWTRADGVVLAASACAGLVAGAGSSRASRLLGVRLMLLPLLACAAQTGFRLAYYGEWVPNSALAKVAFTADRLRSGLAYLGDGVVWLSGLVLLAIPAAWSDASASRRARFLLAPGLFWGAYLVVIGGDIFPARRHLVPVVVILALLAAEGLRGLIARGGRSTAAAWVGAATCLAVLGSMQLFDAENARARSERWEWDGEVIGGLLRSAFAARQPLLAVEAAGTLPYFSGLPAIDMLGINDRFLAQNRPPDFGHGRLGHELGSGQYVLEREPDLVVFCFPTGGPWPCSRSTAELAGAPRFAERYRLVSVLGKEPYWLRSQIWVRAEGGRVGIRRERDRVVLPGYLLMANPQSLAELDAEGRLAVRVGADAPAGFLGLALGAGPWRMRTELLGAPVRARVRRPGGPWEPAKEVAASTFELESGEDGAIDLFVTPAAGGTSHVSALIFEREVPPGPRLSP